MEEDSGVSVIPPQGELVFCVCDQSPFEQQQLFPLSLFLALSFSFSSYLSAYLLYLSGNLTMPSSCSLYLGLHL